MFTNKALIAKVVVGICLLAVISTWIGLLIWGPWIVDGNRLDKLTPGAGAAVNGFRTAVAAIGVGAAALVGVYFTYQTHQLSRSAQYTDRFAKAIEMLADDREARQLGGIYALERVMKDSPYDRPAVIETLASFVRSESPSPVLPEGDDGFIAERMSPVPEAARVAFGVLARRTVQPNDPMINLERCDLRRLYLEDVNLDGVNFSESHLGQSHFPKAKMRGAYFMRTKLNNAHFDGADLSGSKFPEAQLAGASFSDAILDNANFSVSHGITEDTLGVSRSCRDTLFPWSD
ncbi:pentapeptide repeat-containing protein [Streptomyces sp. ME01-18a]|uniref:pentapeptide repeat-containing protein n=1 Tax=Streptomyces sp. ME01-18a TaxID=3028669 RepID=UPI0029B0472C|nr:pentapeptide repeat-containing protein [Streptomyces sp. ME01-18a]MDX3429561.1 pentapeptide repeat-containing protein [Streptomyces sp. ME01-18a]